MSALVLIMISLYVKKAVPCPDCEQTNVVRFYVADLVTEDECEHCGREVEFRRPMGDMCRCVKAV